MSEKDMLIWLKILYKDLSLGKPIHISDKEQMETALKQAIEKLPSAERKGEWIMHIDDLFPAESTQECSQCHHEQPLTIDDNYCPNCGADMRGEEE